MALSALLGWLPRRGTCALLAGCTILGGGLALRVGVARGDDSYAERAAKLEKMNADAKDELRRKKLHFDELSAPITFFAIESQTKTVHRSSCSNAG